MSDFNPTRTSEGTQFGSYAKSSATICAEEEIIFFESVFFPAMTAFLNLPVDGGEIQCGQVSTMLPEEFIATLHERAAD